MKAIIIKKYGSKPVIYTEMPIPKVAVDEVLVEIYAASVNPIDNMTKQGKVKILLSYKMPLILGNDFAGIVTQVGEKVTHFKVGDEVYGKTRPTKIGTFSQYVAVNEEDLALKPKNLNFEEAASIPLVGLTSYQALNEILNMKKGQKILIQAGAGGIGTFAIQLAKYMQLYVATTVSEKGYDLVKQLGADEIINYRDQNFYDVLENYDGVLDTLGNQATIDAFKIVKSGGKIVSISAHPSKKFYYKYKDMYQLAKFTKLIFAFTGKKFAKLEKKYNVTYEFLFMNSSRTQLEFITKLIEDGIIKPIIDRVFLLENTNDALEYSNSKRAKGKIIIKVK